LQETPWKILHLNAGGSIQHDGVPLTIAGVVEQVQHQLQARIAGDVRHRMRPDLRPFGAILDGLFNVAPPAHRKTFLLRLGRIVIQHIDVTLKIADRDQLHRPRRIHIGQTEPTVRTTLVITQFRLFASRGAFEDHHPIMCRHADLLDPVSVQIINEVERLEDGSLRRIGLPDQAWPVEPLIVREELQPADLLIGPGLVPGHALPAFHIGQDLGPTFVVILRRRARRPSSVQVEDRTRGRPKARRSNGGGPAGVEL
jgi:hypothetical protein